MTHPAMTGAEMGHTPTPADVLLEARGLYDFLANEKKMPYSASVVMDCVSTITSLTSSLEQRAHSEAQLAAKLNACLSDRQKDAARIHELEATLREIEDMTTDLRLVNRLGEIEKVANAVLQPRGEE